jgi:hypothetical protein
MELNFGYVASCHEEPLDQHLHKVIEHIFICELFCFYAISALLIFVAKYQLIFVLNLWQCSCYA